MQNCGKTGSLPTNRLGKHLKNGNTKRALRAMTDAKSKPAARAPRKGPMKQALEGGH